MHIRFRHILLLALLACVSTTPGLEAASTSAPKHAIAMYGEPKYPEGFTHFDYTNPDAPKGGAVKEAEIGTFDTLNGFILKGVSAAGIGLIYDTLMVESEDEPFSKYGLVAESIEVSPLHDMVTFKLRDIARFHDGTPITADDVVFTFNTLMKDGHPSFKAYYHDVKSVEKIDDHTVRFLLSNPENRELPLILGQLPVLPKHYWEGKDFSKPTLDIPLGSGAYKIEAFDSGKWIRYTRVADYWGADLPVNKGRFNFDSIQYDYYRDATVAVEAFKAGEYDMRQENIARVWAESYNVPAVTEGRMKKIEIPHEIPTGMQGIVMNIRKDKFKDARVREALQYTLDFEWQNKSFFYNGYKRTESYFSNSDFASRGLPDEAELKLLEPLRDQIPPRVFTDEYHPPKTDGSGNSRANLIKARNLLKDAGYVVKNGILVNSVTNEPFQIEVLLSSPSLERIIAQVIKNMKKLGITANMRTVDSAQYIKRMEAFDYDMTVHVFGQSLSPGNEQIDYWHSSKADVDGSRNVIGIKNPAVDALVAKLIAANTKEELITASRALDRVLLWNFYIIPNWYVRSFRVVYWDKFGRPDIAPKYGFGFDSWWVKK
ncbi:MAG: ABC transporter substrate-binding protein [Proteobacteria bacterium]|nr:ABC transporter substrate-binding protein [Pseudomonadota bacterium]